MNFSLGKYVPYNSLIHRLDPRIKLYGIIALMVMVFLNYSTQVMTFTMMGIVFILIAVLLWASKSKFRTLLSNLKSMWVMVLILLIVYCFLPTTSPKLPAIFTIGSYSLYWDSILMAVKIMVRLMMTIELTMILTSTTKPLDLTYALEWTMTPLKKIHFPAHEIAMTISIALRFIPTLLEDTDKIMKAQESRGVSFKHGSVGKRVISLTSLIVPLFVSSFNRSDELANAMECRGYDPQGKRTRYRILKAKWYDFVSLAIVSLLLGGFIAICATKFDLYNAWFGLNLI